MSTADTLRKHVTTRLSLSTLPASIAKLDRVLRNPDVSIPDVAMLLAEDPPLAAKVLRIANSSYYGLKTRVVALEHAASVLGLAALRNIVLQTAVFEALAHLRGEAGQELRELWKHSVLSAQLMESYTRALRNPELPSPEEVYVVGLLHDIGRFALLDAATFAYARVVAEAKSSGRPLVQVERERLGMTHLQAGTMIAERWALPENSVRAIGGHHDSVDVLTRHPLIALVAISDEVSHALLDRDEEGLKIEIDQRLLDTVKLSHEMLLEIANRIAKSLDEIPI